MFNECRLPTVVCNIFSCYSPVVTVDLTNMRVSLVSTTQNGTRKPYEPRKAARAVQQCARLRPTVYYMRTYFIGTRQRYVFIVCYYCVASYPYDHTNG
jgi:hypothetical protein